MSTDSAPPPSKPPISARAANVHGAPLAVAPVAPSATSAPAATAIQESAAPAVELHHDRRPPRGRSSWLWVALPVAGMMFVPAFGLVYSATTSFGKGATGSNVAPLGSGDEDDDEATGSPGGVTTKRTRQNSKRTRQNSRASKPRSDSAGSCCAKLHELGTTAPLEDRQKYLGAATSCESAPDAELAVRRVKNNLHSAGVEIPPECEGE